MHRAEVVQHVRLLLLLLEPVLDQVAYTYDPNEAIALHDGQMPHSVNGHQLHDLVDPVVGAASGDVLIHDLAYVACEDFYAVLRQAANDITLRERPDQSTPAVRDDERADAELQQLLHADVHGFGGRDGMDPRPFSMKDLRYFHDPISRVSRPNRD